ncbi:hypothetical protein GJW-30_1_04206 [Variibacter gotjawalensis]|uniref:Outer membrane protein beta-barrel domain-containing protein n=1 Tax=Variibacter gotjawalensis TaxID=1333996 RepID=A0A0S3Q0I0_9BRAD|nr:outer membrane beta-barrel protein [Variibacter gotjawalensis]NIK47487.1 opacity protein-like surface antigen [Variibacter gotjawalensis]RZS49382.1 opacity protein-like surface antigen [Variibacter gotjawalensis]BAT61646.1 hypothetical protein GJW-30_1_04206 [Variibacter gotjawalensis]
MRKILLALAAITIASEAGAADLRGPMYDAPVEQRFDWSGTYVGGHGGFTQQRLTTLNGVLTDPLGGNADLVFPFARGSGNTASYGGFIGFNAQWDDIVLGFEFTYNRLDRGTSSTLTNATTYNFGAGAVPALATGTSTQHISDLFGGRFRAGWSTGIFLPYASVGFVVARGESERVGVVTSVANPAIFRAGSLVSDNATPFGFSVGAGVDMMITQNLFARAELEYVGLRESKGVGGQFTTYRAGLGLKF